VKQLRKISQDKVIKRSATDQIRQKVTDEDMRKLSCKEICEKYDFDFKSGTVRKFISRLKIKAQEV